MIEAHNAGKYAEVLKMAEEGQAVAGEVRRAWPGLAAGIYWMLGTSLVQLSEQVKGVGLLEQARALAVEAGDRRRTSLVCSSLGNFHRLQGEHEKAIEEYEQARAIAVQLGDRQSELVAWHNLGLSYRALKQYDKAIELLEQSLAISEELGDKIGQTKTCSNLGVCLSRHGQHDKAVAYLKQAWADSQEHGDEVGQARAALKLGVALWARARAERHQAAPDATSCGGVTAASADTLQEAETWLRTALDLGMNTVNFRMDAQIHLAYVVMMKGDEDEAVELLVQHLTGWLFDFGSHRCAGCAQMRGEDAPMLSCTKCRVVRCVYAATPVLCGRDCYAVWWLTGRCGWMMQILQCAAPADGVEGRD
jgi:tetratricopeptide (TPR) repeat protein